ncbi:hypothetical protein CGMCC3_g5971 [Colletotrichum fructicola]|nr:uncharacterized protein CGMCC3_g5971 [Colletotrichum fructicola]KAE9578117.1 hypothetical protein CGMCC3_g5971 [Colletotrichum fructicola]
MPSTSGNAALGDLYPNIVHQRAVELPLDALWKA